jgi:hypothetical protein
MSKHFNHGGNRLGLSGMFQALMKGKAKNGSGWLPHRRSRHRSSQMKFFAKKWKGGPTKI